MAGKITPSELKFTFQMKDKFAGVNPKDRVKRETFIGTCTHYWFVSSKHFFCVHTSISTVGWMAFTNN